MNKSKVIYPAEKSSAKFENTHVFRKFKWNYFILYKQRVTDYSQEELKIQEDFYD